MGYESMVYHSVLYVSKSTLGSSASVYETVQQIAKASALANSRIAITGAMLFTGTHFVQILEGDLAEIDRLLAVIERDTRHTELRITERKSIAQRRFPTWTMAYMGPSRFVSRHVQQLLEQTAGSRGWRASEWISDLMVEFVRVA